MADLSVIDQLKGEIAAIETGGEAERPLLGNAGSEGAKGAFDKIVALVNASERSEKALRERLARAEFPEDEVDEAVERAKRCGIIDDLRYADVLIRSRLGQGKGAAGIERELREQGIDVERVAEWPSGFGIDDESERRRALVFLESHPSRSKNKREGAYRKLVQRGFASSVAASAARAWAESF